MNATLNALMSIRSFSKEALYTFLEAYQQGVIVLCPEASILYVNKYARKIIEYTPKGLIGKPISLLGTTGQADKISKSFARLVASKRETIAGKYFQSQFVSKSGEIVPVELSLNKISENNNTLIFCTVADIRSQVELQELLYHQAITDSLTGIYNRRYFDERLTQEFTRAHRYRRPFSTIIIDIDGFKQANDLYGHAFGDEMLIKATTLFQQVLREGDTMYRYGGDEFAMLLPETPKEGSMEVAERVRDIFAKQYTTKKHRIKLSLSIGVASYPEDGTEQKSLIGAADNRMYHSKENGGNMITAYDSLEHLGSDTESILRALTNLAHLMEKSRGFSSSRTDINHSQGIRSLSIEIGHKLGLGSKALYLLEQAAMLHDIGAISIPRSLLVKRGQLTQQEWDDIKRHTVIGEEIIEMITRHDEEELAQLKVIVGQHHERLDGSGYPRGLKGNEISMEARILGVTDAYSAMLSRRPYRKAFTKKQALMEIDKYSGIHFDSVVVDALHSLEKMGRHPK